jgi:hypothetical protein
MAHFAQLDPATNVVIRVIVVSNDVLTDDEGTEHEELGVVLCQQLYGAGTKWIQTSYNGNFRRYYAGVGFRYSEEKDVFIRPKPSGSGWVLDEEIMDWVQG